MIKALKQVLLIALTKLLLDNALYDIYAFDSHDS